MLEGGDAAVRALAGLMKRKSVDCAEAKVRALLALGLEPECEERKGKSYRCDDSKIEPLTFPGYQLNHLTYFFPGRTAAALQL